MVQDRLGIEPGILLHLRQGYYLTTVEWKEFPGSPLSHLGYGSRNKDLLWFLACVVAITISMVSFLAQFHLRGRG